MTSKKRNSNKPQSAILALERNDVENIWVKQITGNLYEVLTIPFWAYNLSLGDVVECHPDEDGLGLFIGKVLQKSGNRTVRIAFKAKEGINHPEAQKLVDYFKEHDLRFEKFSIRLFSLNLPSEGEYQKLIKRLDAVPKEAEMIWEDGDPQPEKNLDGSDVVKPNSSL
ncbi:DUF4265 domain-containing protein [candidate division KSB1 bacterium]|nr:DUF4265 domain-containing protein [candidate division KSB1 bacterium]